MGRRSLVGSEMCIRGELESVWSYLANATTSGTFDIPLSRNYTRLASLYCTFIQEPPEDGVKKLCNEFYVHTGSAETLSMSLQLGTRRLYDNDVTGFAEMWHRLMGTIGVHGSFSHATGVTFADYSSSSFAIAADCERSPQLASSGINLSNTSVVQLKIKGFGTEPAHLPSRAHLVAQFDAVIECRDTTVSIF